MMRDDFDLISYLDAQNEAVRREINTAYRKLVLWGFTLAVITAFIYNL